ncbi:hypothetical protein GT347_02355 [Xylophilus rhododendri]|uniref:Uncharacterized protein n=1 Tax=Xylophilus rhododendri TaxID=2697032 RepID=A0A857IZA2_9BURK|nr:hypothetical protein [Xylophilus rhododendri]QHI96930.1 hypothetical protein GT347_02355 [Xylophilus rhododendri]
MSFPISATNILTDNLDRARRFLFPGMQDSSAAAKDKIPTSVADTVYKDSLKDIGEISPKMIDLLGLKRDDVAKSGEVHYGEPFRAKRAALSDPNAPVPKSVFRASAGLQPAAAPDIRADQAEVPTASEGLTEEMQIRLDGTVSNAVAAFLEETGQPGVDLDDSDEPAAKAAAALGRQIARAVKPHLTEYELKLLGSSSPFTDAFKGWVEVYAYRLTFGNLDYTEDGKKLVAWARQEAAQVEAQSDNPRRQNSLAYGYEGGLESERGGTRRRPAPLDAYPNKQDMESYAPCGKFVRLYQFNPHIGDYATVYTRVDPEDCRGNKDTDIAYQLGRFFTHTSHLNVKFHITDMENLPYGVEVPTGDNAWSRNCGPDNILTADNNRWEWFGKGAPECPPYVSNLAKWRDHLKSFMSTDFWAALPDGNLPKALPKRLLTSSALRTPSRPSNSTRA